MVLGNLSRSCLLRNHAEVFALAKPAYLHVGAGRFPYFVMCKACEFLNDRAVA